MQFTLNRIFLIFLCLIFVTVAIPGSTQTKITSPLQSESYNPNQIPLSANVSEIRETVYTFGKGTGFSKDNDSRTVELVPLGHMSSASIRGVQLEGVHQETRVHMLDAEGELVSEQVLNMDGMPQHTLTRMMSDDGRQMEYRRTDGAGNELVAIEHTLDAEGRVIEEKHYSHDEEITLRVFRSFDKQGRVSEETRITTDQTLDERFRYKYSDDGLHVNEEHFTLDDELTMAKMKHWNANGTMLREQYYNDEKSVTAQLIHEHDPEGRIVKTSFISLAKGVEFYRVYRYADHPFPVEVIQHASKGLLYWRNFAYAFDEEGNWVKRVMYDRVMRNDRPEYEPQEMIVREFSYVAPGSLDR